MTTALEIKNKKQISIPKIRKEIMNFEALLLKTPNVVLGDSDVCPLKHSFSDGMYVREIFIPKGKFLTGKIHKHAHPNFLMSGEVTVITESGGKERIKGPLSMISKAGTKRAVYTHTDTVWITVHHNPNNIKDLKKLEEVVIAKNYLEYEQFQISTEESQKLLTTTEDNEIKNCGLIALKNLSNIKNASARTLIGMAEDNGLKIYPYKVSLEELKSIPFPAIVHSENHFDYICKKEDFKSELKYTGNILLTQKTNYPKIKASELKYICGETWVAVVGAGAAVTSAVIGAAVKDTTQCGKDCRAKCKDQYGTFEFSAKNKCKKACKNKCFNETNEPPVEKKSNTGTIIIVAILILTIIGLIWWATRKK